MGIDNERRRRRRWRKIRGEMERVVEGGGGEEEQMGEKERIISERS